MQTGPHDFTVSNVSCTGGGGQLQFGLWDAGVTCGNNNQSNLLDCSGGTASTLTFTQTLTAGQCYLIFFDGNAGATCTWDFTITAPPLAVSLEKFQIGVKGDGNAISWATSTPVSGDFELLRRFDNLVRTEGISEDVQWNNMPTKSIVLGAATIPGEEENSFRYVDSDIDAAGVYIYELYQRDEAGGRRYLGASEVQVLSPPKTRLTRVLPGSESGLWLLEYALAEDAPGEINVYNLAGEKQLQQALGMLQAGSGEAEARLQGLPAGIYIYELKLGGRSFAGKLIHR